MSSIYRIYRAEPSWYAPADPPVPRQRRKYIGVIPSAPPGSVFPECPLCLAHTAPFHQASFKEYQQFLVVSPKVIQFPADFMVNLWLKNQFFFCYSTDYKHIDHSVSANGPWCREALSAPSRTLARISGRARRAPGTCRNLRWRKFKRKFIEITLLIYCHRLIPAGIPHRISL